MVAPNTYIILQARMGSERLPGKVMQKIAGMPMIGIQINRLKQSEIPIILATSSNPENDILADYGKELGVEVFRGSEDNVLERFYLAAKEYKADYIIRMTGDNPLVDGKFIKETLESFDHTLPRLYFSPGKSKTWPVGMSYEFFPFNLLEEAYRNASHPGEREHVTPYMHQNIPGNIQVQTISRDDSKAHYRLTVDSEKDFQLIKALIEKYQCEKESIEDIIKILDEHPELVKINSEEKQKAWDR